MKDTQSRSGGFPTEAARYPGRVDDPRERIAALEAEVRDLRAALEERGRRLVADGAAYADALRQRELVIERLQEEIRIRDAEIEGREQAYQDLINTKTFRYSEKLRRAWGAVRGRR